jgi:type II secretory pathway pseudopilin PulG
MPRRFASRSPNGFTTIESMIAAVVFLVGLAGLLGALVQARNATGQARRLMQATDVANDLAEQMQLWDLKDPRLAETTGPCAMDPLDNGGALSSTGATFTNYVSCMHNETTLKQPNTRFGGLQEPVFVDELGIPTRYDRYYIVRALNPNKGGRRLHIWVKVVYMDAGVRRHVTVHTIRIEPRSM